MSAPLSTDKRSFATYPIYSVVAFVVTGFDGGGREGLTIKGYFQYTYSEGYVPGGSNLGAPNPSATSYFLGLVD